MVEVEEGVIKKRFYTRHNKESRASEYEGRDDVIRPGQVKPVGIESDTFGFQFCCDSNLANFPQCTAVVCLP